MTTEEIAETAWTTLNVKRALGASEEALRATLLSAMRAVEQGARTPIEQAEGAAREWCAQIADEYVRRQDAREISGIDGRTMAAMIRDAIRAGSHV